MNPIGEGAVKKMVGTTACVFSVSQSLEPFFKARIVCTIPGEVDDLGKVMEPFYASEFCGFFFSLLPSLSLCYWCFLLVFETGSSVAQVDLNLTPSQRMALHN